MPFHADRNLNRAFYGALEENQLLVRSIFPTVQGEGPFAGHPAIFVRLAGCNLGAKGIGGVGCEFCDTEFKPENSQAMSFREILDNIELHAYEIAKVPGHPRKLVVITGGEPFIQPNLSTFLFDNYRTWHFQIESNGTMFFPIPMTGVYLVVSPKVLTKGTGFRKPKDDVMSRVDAFKFLVSADPQSDYFRIPDWAYLWAEEKGRPLYVNPIMVYKKALDPGTPEATAWNPDFVDIEACRANHHRAAEVARQTGAIMGMQMHMFAGVC